MFLRHLNFLFWEFCLIPPEAFYFNAIPLVYFCFYFLCFWGHWLWTKEQRINNGELIVYIMNLAKKQNMYMLYRRLNLYLLSLAYANLKYKNIHLNCENNRMNRGEIFNPLTSENICFFDLLIYWLTEYFWNRISSILGWFQTWHVGKDDL